MQMRQPIAANLKIKEFSGANIITKYSGLKNLIVSSYADGRQYVTQRPSINIYEDASLSVADVAGRGNYYWNAVGASYFVNSDTVYKSSYAAPLAANISSGIGRVYFFEIGIYLVILDPENNEGWYISSAADTTLVAISDVDFPPNQTPAVQIAKGGAVLNGVLYVGCTNGEIVSSGVETPITWAALDFITAEVEQDGGVYLEKYNDNLAFFGARSLEFFYDAANPTGSPLSVRSDVASDIGAVDSDSVWSEFGALFFVGVTSSGSIGVYMLESFSPKKVSTEDIDVFLTAAVGGNTVKAFGSGFASSGKIFYLLTLYYSATQADIQITLAYDVTANLWYEWDAALADITGVPIVSWTKSTATRAGEGILSNGDIVTVYSTYNPQDLTEAQVYLVTGYVVLGYISDSGQSGDTIQFEAITETSDFGTSNRKTQSSLRIAAEKAVGDITVQWSNEDSDTFNTGKTIDLAIPGQRIARLGSFRRRGFKLSGATTEQLRIEAIEVEGEATNG